jgi:hypothetical protein
MAIKKSDLYASLWASCDEVRGGMDASQYKDYVLFMLLSSRAPRGARRADVQIVRGVGRFNPRAPRGARPHSASI